MPELVDETSTDGQVRQHAILGIHNLETYLAKHAAFNEWEDEHMTQYHQRLEAGEFLPGAQPHYAEGENPSPVAEVEAPPAEEPQPEPEPMPEPEQPEPPAEPMPDPAVIAEAPAEEQPPA